MTDSEYRDNPLDAAELELLRICADPDRFGTPLDVGSLGRMAVHIRNINHSVTESTRDHVNAAKRLTDFSAALRRLARSSSPPGAELEQRITHLAETLKAAGAELVRSDALPRWTRSVA